MLKHTCSYYICSCKCATLTKCTTQRSNYIKSVFAAPRYFIGGIFYQNRHSNLRLQEATSKSVTNGVANYFVMMWIRLMSGLFVDNDIHGCTLCMIGYHKVFDYPNFIIH